MSDTLLWAVAAVLCTSFLVCVILVVTQRWHGRLSLDHDLNGAQKIHEHPVPRVGGLGLMFGLIVGVIVGHQVRGQTYSTALPLILAAMPVFLIGVLEDITKRVSIRQRLGASFLSAAIAVLALDVQLTRLDVYGLDPLMQWGPLAAFFTCFAIAGVTNAVNIIDGLNGLASGTVVIISAGLAALAWQAGDVLVMKLFLWGIAAMLGFMVLNFPFGRIFLGDGGAYLAGFWMASCAVMLLMRNPSVSTWAVLLSALYPVWETVHSMFRRTANHGSTSHADMGHLHHLVYIRVSGSGLVPRVPSWLRHGVSSALIWLAVLVCQVIALMLANNTLGAILAVVLMALLYRLCYVRLANLPMASTKGANCAPQA